MLRTGKRTVKEGSVQLVLQRGLFTEAPSVALMKFETKREGALGIRTSVAVRKGMARGWWRHGSQVVLQDVTPYVGVRAPRIPVRRRLFEQELISGDTWRQKLMINKDSGC